MTEPVAAELLLLALDEETGRSLVDTTTLAAGLIGAGVVEPDHGRGGGGSRAGDRRQRVVVTPRAAP